MEETKARLFLAGDIHGSYDIKKLNTHSFPEQKELTKEDVLIQLGDFANYWTNQPTKEENYWLNWLAAKPYTFAFIDGNHDNHEMIWNLPVESKWGGIVNVDHRKLGSIYYLRRGEIYTINNKKILTVGGAKSTDAHLRTPGVDWWDTETLNHDQIETTLDNLDLHDRCVDYILSHTCPDHMVHQFTENTMRFHDPVAQFLGHIENITEFKEWHFGHMHRDMKFIDDNGQHFQCHYNGAPHELI